MSKGKFLTKRKWGDFRKTEKSKIKSFRKIKFPRKWNILKEVIHISMGIPKKRRVLDGYFD